MIKLIKHLLGHKFLLFCAISFTIIITTGSLISTNAIPKVDFEISDKTIHTTAYFFLFVVWAIYATLSIYKASKAKIILLTSVLIFIYGIIIEVIQENFVPTRQADLFDVLANTIGILLGILFFNLSIKNILKLKNRN